MLGLELVIMKHILGQPLAVFELAPFAEFVQQNSPASREVLEWKPP